MNFFRRRYDAGWLTPYSVVDRSFHWQDPTAVLLAEYDYFLFTPTSDPGLAGPRVKTIYHDDKTQLTIVTH